MFSSCLVSFVATRYAWNFCRWSRMWWLVFKRGHISVSHSCVLPFSVLLWLLALTLTSQLTLDHGPDGVFCCCFFSGGTASSTLFDPRNPLYPPPPPPLPPIEKGKPYSQDWFCIVTIRKILLIPNMPITNYPTKSQYASSYKNM